MPLHHTVDTESATTDQLDHLIEHLVEMDQSQLSKVQMFINDMAAEQDFSSPVLTDQEKRTLAKMFQI